MEQNDLKISPLKAIRQKCMDCVCDQMSEIKLCPITSCPLYPFRFGKNPYRTRELTDEQRNEMSERLAAARAAKQANQERAT